MSVDSNLQAKAIYDKQPGVVVLSRNRLAWTPDGQSKPTVLIPLSKISNLHCSKEGAPKSKFKVGLTDNDAGHTFSLASPAAVAQTELVNFKRELLEVITRNNANATQAAQQPPSLALPGSSSRKTPRAETPSVSTSKGDNRAASIPGSPRPGLSPSVSSTSLSKSSLPDFEIRKRVLTKMPELASLHKELVISGQITESEFWEGREHLLRAESSVSQQKRGKPSEIVDPRPSTSDKGDLKITLTAQMVTDIFEEFPVVERAYTENVPKPLKEGEFWKRYFESKLFNRHRASARTAVAKDDSIFDKYLEKEDDQIEPLHTRQERVQTILDLAATEEDHGETGNEKDVTMQAGKRKATLPLIRRFNEHSEKLLQSALGDSTGKRRRTNAATEDANTFSQIDLEDLHDPESTAGLALEMQDRQRYFEGRVLGGDSLEMDKLRIADLSVVLGTMTDSLHSWRSDLSKLRMERRAAEDALKRMTLNVSARLNPRTKRNNIPDSILQQMTTCHTAANEFLRQFWLSIYPPPNALSTSMTTPAQKAAKAAKMIGYLEKTGEKVDSIVQSAVEEGVDANAVQTAFQPLLEAVEKALQTYKSRRPAGVR